MVVINANTGIDKIQDGTVNSAKIVDGTVTNNDLTTPYRMVQMTPVNSTSGTSIDFTGIPSWAKRITVMFNGVSTNGASPPQVQIGSLAGVASSGYLASSKFSDTNLSLSTTGFIISPATAATSVFGGKMNISQLSGNSWVSNSIVGYSNAVGISLCAGSVTLSGTLDRIRITTVNGTDTFDAGQINIMYEG